MEAEVVENVDGILNYLGKSEAILKDTLRTMRAIPKGRKRSQKKQSSETEENDVDFSEELKDLRLELEMRKKEAERVQKDIATVLIDTQINGSQQSKSFGLGVSTLNNRLLLIGSTTKQLASSLKTTSTLADAISGRVSALDIAKTRVVECLQLSSDMRDLNMCAEGVDKAISAEDFETAAQQVHRFLTLDKAVFQYRESGERGETANSVRHNYNILTSATERLRKILESRLDDAVKKEDVPTMQRFVKLFPLINESLNGLQRFSVYINKKINKTGEDFLKIMKAGGTDDKRVNVLYADTLFLFFEGIADILDSNQSIIENSYESEKLLDFMSILQKEVDSVVAKIIEAFEKNRKVGEKTRMVQRILNKNPNHERLNALELDVLLSEMCLMNTHAEMYWRFIRRRVGSTKASDDDEGFVILGVEKDYEELTDDEKKKVEEEKSRRKADREKKLDQLLYRSLVGTSMQELLGNYILLENYYMQDSVRKAIEMDQKDDEKAVTSSVIDDTLFIVRKCLKRAASSGSVDAVCASMNNVLALMETSFYDHLQSAVSAGYPSVGFAAEALQTAQTAYNVIQHGKTVTEAGPEAQKEAFLTAVNNARSSAILIRDLRRSLHSEWTTKSKRPQVDQEKLEHACAQLEEIARKMELLSIRGVESLCSVVFKPKLKASCDNYKELPHELTYEEFSSLEANDPFIEEFTATVDKQIAMQEAALHPDNYQALLLVVCTEVAGQLERVILKCNFNRYGALQLDREFRHISGYLSGVAGWTARERCAKLAQIVAMMNVETLDEAMDLWQHASSTTRTLSSKEAKMALLRRSEFPHGLVNALNW